MRRRNPKNQDLTAKVSPVGDPYPERLVKRDAARKLLLIAKPA